MELSKLNQCKIENIDVIVKKDYWPNKKGSPRFKERHLVIRCCGIEPKIGNLLEITGKSGMIIPFIVTFIFKVPDHKVYGMVCPLCNRNCVYRVAIRAANEDAYNSRKQ